MKKEYNNAFEFLVNLTSTVLLALTVIIFSLFLKSNVKDIDTLITTAVNFTLKNLWVVVVVAILLFIILSVKHNAKLLVREFGKDTKPKTLSKSFSNFSNDVKVNLSEKAKSASDKLSKKITKIKSNYKKRR